MAKMGFHAPLSPLSDVRLRLLGEHQLDNAAAAVAAAACLRQHGLDRIGLQAVAAGLEAATLPGRFQLCQFQEDADAAAAAAARAAQGGSSGGAAGEAGPWVVLDGAHTPESAAALARTLRQAFPTAPVALVVAMAEDKQHRWGVGASVLLSDTVALLQQLGEVWSSGAQMRRGVAELGCLLKRARVPSC